MFYLYQITICLIFLLFILSKIKKNLLRKLFSIVASFFLTIEIAAVYMTGKFIDYRFYNHMNLNDIASQSFQFGAQVAAFSILLVLMSILFYLTSKKISDSTLHHNRFFIPAVLTSFILLSLSNGVFNETYKIYEILNAQEKGFNQALTDVGIPPEKYITPDQLIAEKGKNIIVISIESLEQGFLGKDFDNIAPNLSKLSTEWTFFNKMPVGYGGNWTAGSLYSYQVGMPAMFKGHSNENFRGVTSVKLTGLGHILNKAGYDIKYLVGNAEFAGMADILHTYGIPVVSEDSTLGRYPDVPNGLHDYDLFREAKLQIKGLLKDKNRPFALFMSTINSHFPNGIYDKRMEQFISKRENDLEFSVSAVDYLVNDFLIYLKENNLLKNTSIYIFPDHTLLGSTGPVHKKLAKSKRQIYLLTNVDEKKLPQQTSDTIYQIDLPRIILAGADIKTNAKFLADFIKTKNINDFIDKNRVKLTTLNNASLTRNNFQNGISIFTKDEELVVKSSEDIVKFKLSPGKEVFDITFNQEMVLIKKGKTDPESVFILNEHDNQYKTLHLIITLKNKKIYIAYLGNKKLAGLYKRGCKITYSTEEVHLLMELNNEAPAVCNPTQKIQHDPTLVSITSSEWKTSMTLKSVIKADEKEFALGRGLNLLTVDRNEKYHLENFDTYNSQAAADKFLLKLETLIKNHDSWAIAAHDAIKNNYPGYKEKLSELNFKLLQTLSGRAAYISYVNSYKVLKEYSSKTSLSCVIPRFRKPLSQEELKIQKYQNNIEANSYRKDKDRFIAHAGGEIDGHTYSDSLEALNLSYQKGFRLFELDIIKTSDNIYVGAHDWEHWAEGTGYKGNLPPDRKTFKKYKIYGRYSPLDITDINKWFKNHPDAILVTDKVNTPIDFSKKFIDKGRLMMELFTWDAVRNGLKAKIKAAMPTGSILKEIEGDKIVYLKNLGIKNIAISRRSINDQSTFLLDIAKAGIKTYAFHVNFDKGMDEEYVVCKERNFFYGMYADKWDFTTNINCR